MTAFRIAGRLCRPALALLLAMALLAGTARAAGQAATQPTAQPTTQPTTQPTSTARHRLLHNPFTRPAAVLPRPAAQDDQGGVASEPATPRLRLRSVLLAGPDSVVSINGQVLRLGERIEGYRLTAVRGTQAVLVKGRERLVLDMEDEEQIP